MESGEIDPLALDRYFTGESSAEEFAAVETWLSKGGRRAYYHALRDGAAKTPDLSPQHIAHARRLIVETITVERDDVVSRSIRRNGPCGTNPAVHRGLFSLPVIAFAALAVSSVVFLGRRAFDATSLRASVSTFVTATGQQAHIGLPDGSHIVLAPQSRLSIDQDFGAHARAVTLNGEGYFVVNDAKQLPFVVQAGNTFARVLGTTFTVRSALHGSPAQLAVISGRVAVDHTTLDAGMLATISDSIVVTRAPDRVTDIARWTRGQLAFHGTAVDEMLHELSRWYGYDLQLSDTTLGRRHVTAVFDAASPTTALTELQHLLDVTLTFRGNVVTLVPRRRQVQNFEQTMYQHSTEVGR